MALPANEPEQLADDLAKHEALAIFDQQSQRIMGMSGREFLRRYDLGEFDDIPDDLEHGDFQFLEMLIPLGR